MILCQHGCGQPAIHKTKGSLGSGPFKGAPVHQCAKSANSCPAVKQRKIDSSIKKYGTAYPWQTPDIIERRNQTNLDKYGHVSSVMNPEIQAKRKATMLKRYGVEEPTQNQEIRTKAANAVRQSYINDPTLSARQVKSKRKKYGEDLTEIVKKSRATQIANGRWVDPALKTEWSQYKFRVKYLTAKTYKKYKHLINPDELPIGRCEYQIDHIYSIREGFEHKDEPELVAHIKNLRMLWHTDNKSKHIRSDQTLEELIAKTKGS
jgi:hypothetical protein